jgi:hypothetical protein
MKCDRRCNSCAIGKFTRGTPVLVSGRFPGTVAGHTEGNHILVKHEDKSRTRDLHGGIGVTDCATKEVHHHKDRVYYWETPMNVKVKP